MQPFTTPESHTAVLSRRTDIQGLRALAVLLVVIFHAGLPVPGGFAGVDVFFVISGFVITRMLGSELAERGRLDWPQFYLRRIRRLLPALATLSVVVALVAMLANPIGTQVMAAQTGIAATLFVANAHLYRSAPGYFSPGAEFNPMLHTWSLAVEEQFYLFYPLVLAGAWRWAARSTRPAVRRWGVLAVLGALLGVSFALACAMSYGWGAMPGLSAPRQFAFYGSPTRAWEFAVGAALALCSASLLRLPAGVALGAGWVGLALLGWSAWGLDGSVPFPGWVAWGPVAGTALLIVGGAAGENVLTRWLSSPLAQWIGDRSYGWYLWHWPFVVFARALWPDQPWVLVLASALSLVPAWASYRYIETPIRHARTPSTAATLRLGAVCVLGPLLAFGGLLLAHQFIVTRPSAQPIQAALELHIDEVRHCEGVRPLLAGGQPGCTWAVPHARGHVVLLGDSNAGHFTEAVVKAANDAGYSATVATLAGCPLVDAQLYNHGEPNTQCQHFVADAVQAISQLRPSLVMLATAADGYIEEPGTGLRAHESAATSALATSPQDKAQVWQQGLDRLLGRLNQTAPVLVVQPVPRFRHWALTQCAAWKVALNPLACDGSTPRDEMQAWRARAVASQQAAVARHPRSSSLELADVLCPQPACNAYQDGVWLFRDGAHLSVPGALTLAAPLRAAIEARAQP